MLGTFKVSNKVYRMPGWVYATDARQRGTDLAGSIPKSIHPRYHWSCAASPPTRAYLSLLLAVCTAAVAFRVHDMEWRVRVDAEAL